MDKDWVQERIDELYLLEKQAQDRLGRLEVHYEKRLASLQSQEKSAQEMVRLQRKALTSLTDKVDTVHAWYRQVVKLGGIITGIIILGLACLFLWWWHVDTVANNTQALQSAIHGELNHLPYLMTHNGKTYIRIVPDASVPDLKDSHGRSVDGDYAQVYLSDEQKD